MSINTLVFILIYVFAIPFSILLHEVGHAIGGVVVKKDAVAKVYLGQMTESNKKNFHIGRIHFHVNWAFYGFCSLSGEKLLTRFQKSDYCFRRTSSISINSKHFIYPIKRYISQ